MLLFCVVVQTSLRCGCPFTVRVGQVNKRSALDFVFHVRSRRLLLLVCPFATALVNGYGVFAVELSTYPAYNVLRIRSVPAFWIRGIGRC